jgi:hypothetical protein
MDGQYVLDFGKHSGKTIEQIHVDDESYLTWFLEVFNGGKQTADKELACQAINEYLEEVV